MSELVPEFGGCVWPMDPACETDEWEAFDDDVQERALALASATLARLTAHRVGNCPVTIRVSVPCRAPLGYETGPRLVAGDWVNSGCGCEGSADRIEVPGPIGRIDEIRIDGVTLDPSDYAYEVGGTIHWQGAGKSPFIRHQNLSLPEGAPGTMSITYLNAFKVDALGAYAVGLLALEFAKACTKKTCALPPNVTMLVRQGVTMQIASGAFPDGKTGIRQVDAWIALYNPEGRTSQSTVWSPDQDDIRII